jgi:HSP20 family protein
MTSSPHDEQQRRLAMLMRTDPFRDLDRIAQQVFGTAARPAAMPIDAFRRGDEFVVQFDLPGVDPNSIELTVEKNVLSVHAERRRTEADDVELLVGERSHGTFSRQLFLGETLDADRIAADYTDGVLNLRIPIEEQAKARRVPINVTGGERASLRADSIESHEAHPHESVA